MFEIFNNSTFVIITGHNTELYLTFWLILMLCLQSHFLKIKSFQYTNYTFTPDVKNRKLIHTINYILPNCSIFGFKMNSKCCVVIKIS